MDSRTCLTYYLLHSPITKLGSSLYDFVSPKTEGLNLSNPKPCILCKNATSSTLIVVFGQGAAWTFTLMLKVGKVQAGPFWAETLGKSGKDWAMNHSLGFPRIFLKTLAASYIHDDS